MNSIKPIAHLEKIALDASLHALAEQEGRLRDLRARASTLLAAAALVASFLGTRALDRDGLSLVGWLAVGSFAVSLLATLYVSSSQKGLAFAIDGPELCGCVWEVRDDVTEVHHRLSHWFAALRTSNRLIIDRLHLGYQIAAVALVAQTGLWVVQLAAIL